MDVFFDTRCRPRQLLLSNSQHTVAIFSEEEKRFEMIKKRSTDLDNPERHNWAHSMGPQRSPLSRVVVVVGVVVVDIDFTLPFTRCRYCRTPPAL